MLPSSTRTLPFIVVSLTIVGEPRSTACSAPNWSQSNWPDVSLARYEAISPVGVAWVES